MHQNPHHHLGDFLLPGDSIIHREGGNLDGNRSPWRQYMGIYLHTFRHQGLQGYVCLGEGGSIGCVLVPPAHPDTRFSDNGGSNVRRDVMALPASSAFLWYLNMEENHVFLVNNNIIVCLYVNILNIAVTQLGFNLSDLSDRVFILSLIIIEYHFILELT